MGKLYFLRRCYVIPVAQYLKLGYSGIISISSVIDEENKNNRIIREVAACIDEYGDYWLLTTVWIFVKRHESTRCIRKEKEVPLKQEDYERIKAEAGIADTPDLVAELEAESDSVQDRRESLAPYCPRCNTQMLLLPFRINVSKRYWGCPNRNQCDYRVEVEPSTLERYYSLKKA